MGYRFDDKILKQKHSKTDVDQLITIQFHKSELLLEPYSNGSIQVECAVKNAENILNGLKNSVQLLNSVYSDDCNFYNHPISYGKRLSSLIILSILKHNCFRDERTYAGQINKITDGYSRKPIASKICEPITARGRADAE